MENPPFCSENPGKSSIYGGFHAKDFNLQPVTSAARCVPRRRIRQRLGRARPASQPQQRGEAVGWGAKGTTSEVMADSGRWLNKVG